MSQYLTPRQVAKRWGCSSRQVQRLCARGELAGLRLGTSWRIRLDAVEAYELAHTTEPDASTSNEGRKEEPPAELVRIALELPAGYVPVFPALWPWHEPQANEKRRPAVTKRR